MPIEYPVMIAAFKEWYGQNKTRPSPTVEIDGQPAVRKSSFGEMIQSGLIQLGTLGAEAGFSYLSGGAEGFAKFVDKLPPAIGEPAKALRETAGTAYDSFKAGINSVLPEGGSFGNALSSTMSGINDHLINPTAEIWNGFKAALSGDSGTLNNLSDIYNIQDNNLQEIFANAANKLGTGIHDIMDSAKGWTDSLTIGKDFTLSDALETANNGASKFLSTYVGIGEAPSLTDLAGTYLKKELVDDFTGAKTKEEQAKIKLRQAAAVKFPTVDVEYGGPMGVTTIPNPDLANIEGITGVIRSATSITDIPDTYTLWKGLFITQDGGSGTLGNAAQIVSVVSSSTTVTVGSSSTVVITYNATITSTTPSVAGSLTFSANGSFADWYGTLTESEKNDIIAEYEQRKTDYVASVNDLETAGNAIKNQIRTDQKNVLLSVKAGRAVEDIMGVANRLNSITDPYQRSLYEATIDPGILSQAKALIPLLNESGNIPDQPEVPPDTIV